MSFSTVLTIILGLIDLIIPIIVDFAILLHLLTIKLNKIDKTFLIILGLFCFLISSFISERAADIIITLLELISLTIYFLFNKKENRNIVLGSVLTFAVFDEVLYLLSNIFINLIRHDQTYFSSIISISLEIIAYLTIKHYIPTIRKLITDKNSKIFIGILLYLYLLGIGVEFYISGDNRTTEVVTISLILLALQSIFAFVLYFAMVHTENNLLSKKDQEQQKLRYELLKTKNQELNNEYKQLKEYADYLDKNEDDLRKFKHDYQNMLNSLIISAEEGKTSEVVNKLKEYTNSHIDEKALRKYKGLNHVHIDYLKSIAIAKLAKLYNSNLDYSFGCDNDLDQIPHSVDYLDLTRLIGIAFDNAYEESIALQKETGKPHAARIEAMYYQENGDFEFEIKNKIRKREIDQNKISQKNYTTKQYHMGYGLANVKEIAQKYKTTMMINYGVEDNWFVFNLVIFPDNMEE